MVCVWVLSACGGGGGGGFTALPGGVQTGEDGHAYFVDPNQSGQAESLHLIDVFWGRLVDVFDVDEEGNPRPRPVFRNFVVNENVPSNGLEYTLETNPINQAQRLIIHRSYDPEDPEQNGPGSFLDLLRGASSSLGVVLAKNDDGSSSPPFSFVARNACLVLRFSDLLDDSEDTQTLLPELVRFGTGYPPEAPFEGRVLFDPNHGGAVGARFHSTRILYDFTVSLGEVASLPQSLPINSFGLPASRPSSTAPNAALRIPSELDFQTGQFQLLKSLGGRAITPALDDPVDVLAATRDVVRAMRSGNETDINSGFLVDIEPPQILGTWPLFLTQLEAVSGDETGLLLAGRLQFDGPCRKTPLKGDVFTIGEWFFRVARSASAPNVDGIVNNVRIELLAESPPSSLLSLQGAGFYQPVFDPFVDVESGCWINISPSPGIPPQRDVSPSMQAILRFTEPMEPTSVIPIENFQLVRGAPGTLARWDTVVVGRVDASGDLREFRFTPSLPLAHRQNGEEYHFVLKNLVDLSGNPLPEVPPFIRIAVDPAEPAEENGGISLFFDSTNEILPDATGNEIRGQFFYDFSRGEIRPRPVTSASAVADRVNPVPGIMIPYAPGVQTPLSPLGSKLQTMWRYVDFGWQVLDESLYNLDITGINWSPVEGQVVADFYPKFEMRVGHTHRLPVECREVQYGLPLYPGSGLHNHLFAANVFNQEGLSQEIVHEAQLGYAINPIDRFVASSGRIMMPFPWNQGRSVGDFLTYTWRDTRSQALGGPGSRGLPLCIEIGQPLFLEDGPPRRIRMENDVPTFGLPLLMEFRCFPSDSGVGLNAFDISLASNSSIFPYFRTYSTGGIDRFGNPQQVQPDLEDRPMGGFNPSSAPPGQRTPSADPSFYIGQLDYIVRLSQVHTCWIDARPSPAFDGDIDYSSPTILPPPVQQPPGTLATLEFRGATQLLDMGAAAFDASSIDIYGDVFEIQTLTDQGCNQCIRDLGTVIYLNNDAGWKSNMDDIDGASFFQVRITFLNNVESQQVARLKAMGFPILYR